jgi:hypothetical protein
MGLALALLAGPTSRLEAADEVAAEKQQPGWTFDIMPYAWVPNISGTVQVKDRTAHVDLTADQLLNLLVRNAFATGGYFGAQYDRWMGWVDPFGGFLNLNSRTTIPTRFCTANVDAKVNLKIVLLDVAAGYQLGRWSLPGRSRPVSLAAYVGTRYAHVNADINASLSIVHGVDVGGSVSSNVNTAQPLIGARWEVPLMDRLSLEFRGDIGGLPSNDRKTWGLVGDMRYWLSWSPLHSQTSIVAGYRAVNFHGATGPDASASVQLRGALIGMEFTF